MKRSWYFFLGMILVFSSSAVHAQGAKRGPSTPEERKQALEYIRDFETNPFGPNSLAERQWLVRWTAEIPDVHVIVCSTFDKLLKKDKKDTDLIFIASVFSQTEFLLEHPDKANDVEAQLSAGVDGMLKFYEVLIQAKPKDKQDWLDDLLAKRTAGTLDALVKERIHAGCSEALKLTSN